MHVPVNISPRRVGLAANVRARSRSYLFETFFAIRRAADRMYLLCGDVRGVFGRHIHGLACIVRPVGEIQVGPMAPGSIGMTGALRLTTCAGGGRQTALHHDARHASEFVEERLPTHSETVG